jgi:hypothetical protein
LLPIAAGRFCRPLSFPPAEGQPNLFDGGWGIQWRKRERARGGAGAPRLMSMYSPLAGRILVVVRSTAANNRCRGRFRFSAGFQGAVVFCFFRNIPAPPRFCQ